MHRLLNISSKRHYSDIEVVQGLQSRNRNIEEWFYADAKQYFMNRFNDVFFDNEQKMTVFQDSFVRLWTQIENGEISVVDDRTCRRQKDGQMQPMTCSLDTFLFAIAKNDYREIVRKTKDIYVEDYFESYNTNTIFHPDEDDETDVKIQVVDECIQMLPPRCLEILTLFYIKGKSLDEILEIRKDKNTSKIGLKSAKYKCMNTLREKIFQMFNQLNIRM